MAGAVTTIVLWLVDELTPLSLPTVVAGAISLLVTTGIAYLVPSGDGAAPETTEHQRRSSPVSPQ